MQKETKKIIFEAISQLNGEEGRASISNDTAVQMTKRNDLCVFEIFDRRKKSAKKIILSEVKLVELFDQMSQVSIPSLLEATPEIPEEKIKRKKGRPRIYPRPIGRPKNVVPKSKDDLAILLAKTLIMVGEQMLKLAKEK